MKLKKMAIAIPLLFAALGWGEAPLNVENKLDLYVYPPIHKINWARPRSALLSLLGSGIKKKILKSPRNYVSLVGHAITHIRCTGTNGQSNEVWFGLTGQNNPDLDDKLVFEQKLGLGALFYDYQDGSVDPEEKSRFEITNYRGRTLLTLKRIKPEFLRVPVGPEACDRAVKMASDLRSISWDGVATLAEQNTKPVGEILHFGFRFDPYEDYLRWIESGRTTKMGGGCASMAIAFLKATSNFSSLFDQRWTQHLDIGESRIGKTPEEGGTEDDRVSLLSLLGVKGGSWKLDGESSRLLTFYDPELMWRSVHNMRLCQENSTVCKTAARRDLQTLENAYSGSQSVSESFQVRDYWLTAVDSGRGATLNHRPKQIYYNKIITRQGLELLQ